MIEQEPRHAAGRRRSTRGTGLLVLATLAGVWMGATAPSVSPVTPATPPPTAATAPAAGP